MTAVPPPRPTPFRALLLVPLSHVLRRRTSLSLVVAAAMALALVAPAAADSASTARQRREQVRAKKAQLASELNALKASDQQLEAGVRALDAQLAGAQAKAAAARQSAEAAQRSLAEAQTRLAATEQEITRLRGQVVGRAVESYMHPSAEEADTIPGDVAAAVRAQALLDVVSGRDEDVLDQLAAAKQDQEEAQRAAQAAREVAASRDRTTSAELAKVTRARNEQARLQRALEGRIRSFQSEADALSREDARLATLIQSRSAQRASRSASDPGSDGRVSGAGLIWPLRGPVTSEYGSRWGRMHEGIDISGSTGTPIRAAKAGEVIFVGAQGGYGNMTLVDHGGGLVTAYPHQSRFGTSEGAQVAQGQVIGYVGCTGSCSGPHLHFEVRVNGSAQNPRRYLP